MAVDALRCSPQTMEACVPQRLLEVGLQWKIPHLLPGAPPYLTLSPHRKLAQSRENTQIFGRGYKTNPPLSVQTCKRKQQAFLLWSLRPEVFCMLSLLQRAQCEEISQTSKTKAAGPSCLQKARRPGPQNLFDCPSPSVSKVLLMALSFPPPGFS